jgi:chromosome segregation protein
MRLSKIKLAGFKSFVDPTTISFETNLTGVVGPNGCGKSNIIDAVRWVMGEMSAKHLRGDSMADVIFNGSSARQPVGSASIELLFDNSDGSVGGQYAAYSEISVRRSVERDGISTYSMNGTRCRRKDITDLFLGTGLGSRSYAIIEQGMITRLIDAKPDELRVYLEEAAGISRYKERRRETESRIRHTRDNLSRLDDVREEVTKQIQHLQRQARAADRYKKFQDELRRVRAEILLLRLDLLRDEGNARERYEAEHRNKVDAALAEQRQVESKIEKVRVTQDEANTAFNGAQAEYYRFGSEVSSIEQAIQHGRELRRQREEEFAQVRQQSDELGVLATRERGHRDETEALVVELDPRAEQAQTAEVDATTKLEQAETAMQAWQDRWDTYAERSGVSSRTSQVQRTAIEHLEIQERSLLTRMTRVEQERAVFAATTQEAEVAESTAREETLAAELKALQERASQGQGTVAGLRDKAHQLSTELDASRTELQSAQGRLASLEALQQAALATDDGSSNWLESEGLAKASRLAERLDVDDGWAPAVETVLGAYLEAVCVDDLSDRLGSIADFASGRMTLFVGGGDRSGADGLAAKVRGPDAVVSMLRGVRTADTLRQARGMLSELADGESVVTPDGIWLSAHWARVARPSEDEGGIIVREKALREVEASANELGAAVHGMSEDYEALRVQLTEEETARDDAQMDLNRVNREHAGARAHLDAVRARRDEAQAKREALDAEHQDLERGLRESGDALKAARGELEGAIDEMATLEDERGVLLTDRESTRGELDAARASAQVARGQAQELRVRLESSRSTLESSHRGLERLEQQQQRLQERRAELETHLAAGDAPEVGMREQLEGLLSQRMEAEQALGAARDVVEGIHNDLRDLDRERVERERTVQERRELLDNARLEARESRVRAEDVSEQLTATGLSEDELRAELDEAAELDAWQERAGDLDRKIERIGPVNLAAIDEFEEQSQRKTYLDAQHADLIEALETLETAMRRIDRETRTRFKETFDKVNAGLKSRFPRLFGGGHAYLELIGDDLLESGVAIMARPPGKRNSTIHLLSGGEKALTAAALVFAIFDLNPAPFCLLDEVDAPLDDANVSRFCELVEEMSERVQIVLITHNKVTMEMTRQLTGVTMSEPGVSRLVAVDLEQAVQMAQAG